MLLVADSGGSKTLLQIYDANNMVNEFVFEGCGAVSDSSEDLPVLRRYIEEIVKKYRISAAAFNLGGRNKSQIIQVLRRELPDIPIRVVRESEGDAALALARHYQSELVLLAGTGTIAVGQHPHNQEMVISGGWGAIMGDKGSGYDIGLKALQHCVDEMDCTEPLSLLTKTIIGCNEPISKGKTGAEICTRRDELFYHVSPLNRSHIASYTKVVADCCQKGDKISLKILEDAGKDMAKLVSKTIEKLELRELNGVIVTGGLIRIKEYWQHAFEATLNSKYSIKNYYYISDGVMKGTRYIAEEMEETICL